MTEQEMKNIMYRNIAVTCQELLIHEVAALYMNTVLNGNDRVESIVGYDNYLPSRMGPRCTMKLKRHF